ncbi:hypothetical protein Z949_1905 [Sulfitobacter guttiformis KCTC 32187]|nr:hypothetical protein Z949_1905 [Sulfitobacter guttiformis KCTC 32187]
MTRLTSEAVEPIISLMRAVQLANGICTNRKIQYHGLQAI